MGWKQAIMFYALQLVVQPLAALYYTLPFGLHWPAFKIIDDQNKETEWSHYSLPEWSHYRTLANGGEPGHTTDYRTHYTALMALAEANRMAPFTYQDFHHAEAVAMRLKDQANNNP